MGFYVCKGICSRYPKASKNGVSLTRHIRTSSYYDLEYKYCRECENSYFKEDWSKFKNPINCNCCGMRMRVRPVRTPYWDYPRYD